MAELKKKLKKHLAFPMPFEPCASSFPFYLLLIFFVIGDSLSEAGAGSVKHSDTSSQPNIAYSSDQTMGSQMVSNIPQAEINVPGKIYPSQQLVGHYQQISGVR